MRDLVLQYEMKCDAELYGTPFLSRIVHRFFHRIKTAKQWTFSLG